jgi:hypothetical protein
MDALLHSAHVAALAARGVCADDAALLLASAPGGGGVSADAAAVAVAAAARGACTWRELFSTRYAGRPYYHNTDSGATTWEARARGGARCAQK